MALRINLVRPDDLLNAEVECLNLQIDASDSQYPALVPIDPTQPCDLVFTLPAQTILEGAMFEIGDLDPPPGSGAIVFEDPPPTSGLPARLGGPTRVVFRFVANPATRIPYSMEALLRWSTFSMNVPLVAAIPEAPTAEQTLQAPEIVRPAPNETAIEIPYKLWLSPLSGATWALAPRPVAHRGWTELWHARLARETNNEIVEASRESPMPVRAVWTRDWDAPGTLPGPPAPTDDASELPPYVTALTPYHRKQIVLLTSAFHGFTSVDDFDNQSQYEPSAVRVEQLMLTPLGGWLRSRGEWDPPYAPQPEPPIRRLIDDWQQYLDPAQGEQGPVELRPVEDGLFVPALNQQLGQPLTLMEWTHVASQGRDHYVRVVEKGCLYGTRHPATLVTITERRFRDVNGTPVAYLAQRKYVMVRRQDVDYPRGDNAASRAMPFERIRLTTLVTPPILHPTSAGSAIPGAPKSFWIRTIDPATSSPMDFRFHGIGYDRAGHEVDFTTSLIFVGSDEPYLAAVQVAYRESDTRRAMAVAGQKVTFATPSGDAADNTTLITKVLYLDADLPTGNAAADACRFRPKLDKADVRLPAAEQFLGTDRTATIRLDETYLKNNFDAAAGVFARIDGDFRIDFQASKAGGIATPNLDVKILSRAYGPLGGKAEDAAADRFKPEEFFPPGTAALFGTLDLSQLILKNHSVSVNAPKLQSVRESGKVVTTFDWAPTLENEVVVDIMKFRRLDGSSLVIKGRIEAAIGGNSAKEETQSTIHGTLTSFDLDFLNVVTVSFESFGFLSKNGAKPEIAVKLRGDNPVKFGGDLDFIEKLSEAIPPGLFGDGPSLEINDTRIRAGFGFALPPLEVGVFALRDVALSTALELPFADGKPFLEFAFSERHHPFQLAVLLFGGGGFFRLQLDSGGVRQLECALEFGVVAALDLGVAAGSVHYLGGMYFSLLKDKDNVTRATIAGYIRCGGEMRMLGIISVSVEFNITLGYSDPKVFGRATLTVEVEVACFSKSVELTVERRFGKNGGDPPFRKMFGSAPVWDGYASAFA